MSIDRDKVRQSAEKHAAAGRFDKAIAEYQKLLTNDPNDIRALLWTGDLFLKAKQFEPALIHYERVGKLYVEQGLWKKAVAVYARIRTLLAEVPRLADNYTYVLPRLIELHVKDKNPTAAISLSDEHASALFRDQKNDEALTILELAKQIDPNNPLPSLRRAEWFVKESRVDEAFDEFAHAAEILLRLERRDDALKVVERLLQQRVDPQFARIAAEAYLERGAGNDALLALQKLQICIKATPKDLSTLELLARAFDQLGQGDKALAVLKEAARIAHESDPARFAELVDTLARRAPSDESVARLVRERGDAPAATSPSRSPSLLLDTDSSGSMELQEGELEVLDGETSAPAALELATSVIDSPVTGTTALAHEVLAEASALWAKGSAQEAIFVIQSSLPNFPNSWQLREQYCDYLVAVGQRYEAADEMVRFAHHLWVRNELDRAGYLLEEALQVEPGHAGGIELLNALLAAQSLADHYSLDQPSTGLGDDIRTGPLILEPSTSAGSVGVPSSTSLDEHLLEQVDDFTAQGRFAEAQACLQQEMARLPNHPLLIERQNELELLTSGAIAAEAFSPQNYDIAQSLAALDSLAPGASSAPSGRSINADAVFEQFRAHVASQVPEADSATHYDLGVAYREMGLYPDAIKELEMASLDPDRTAICCYLLGDVHLRLGAFDAAVEALGRGLQAPQRTAEHEAMLLYELGNAYQEAGSGDQARTYFHALLQRVPDYDEPRGSVQLRLQTLGG